MPPAEAIEPRVYGWTEIERLAERLARRLREETASSAAPIYTAVPRGGLFVLATLSYLLDLEAARIAVLGAPAGAPPDVPVVLVDDCALSGSRIARSLDRLALAEPDRPVIVALLLAHPALCAAVEATEPRVIACLAAGDLVERDDLPARTLDRFEERWRERLPGRRYWLRPVRPVLFPWSEPETVWWNERDQRLEDGWRRASPRCSVRSRAELGLPAEAGIEAAEDHGRYDLAPGALWKLERAAARHGDDAQDRLSIRSADDRLYGFTGTGLEVWRALLAGGDRATAAKHLSTLYEVAEAEARQDVDDLVEELLDRGLLVRRDSGSGAASTG